MAQLPKETESEIKAQAAINEAVILRSHEWVASMKGTVKYLDGDKVKRTKAEKLVPLFFANES